MLHAVEQLLALVAPPRSLQGVVGVISTSQEHQALGTLTPFALGKNALAGRHMHHIDHLVAGGLYGASPVLRSAIARWKYRGDVAYARMCAGVALRALPLLRGGGVLCPVPLHWSRRWWRGFNQAEFLADSCGAAIGLPVRCLLQRKRATGSQARRTHAERRFALDGAFVLCGVVPPHVVLIDDVMTTGSTLDACAATLRRAGCAQIEAVVIAA